MVPLNPEQISRYYQAWSENQVHREWTGLWSKQIKVRICGDRFVSLNKMRNRLGFQFLKSMCLQLQPSNVYMSVLNWLMPERVGEKRASSGAYPIGGEYVVDIDSYLNYQPHSHRTTEDGVCKGCLINSKELTERFLDEISENYSGIRVVFSVKAGFHIHVLDFDVRDWSSYNERSPLKSHEVARFLYTKHLNESVGGYDRHHFVVSSDVMRVITFPESLNGSTGMICSSLSNSAEFSRLGVDEILESARKARGIIQGVNFTPLDRLRVPSRLEPHRDGVVIWSQILCGGAEARR